MPLDQEVGCLDSVLLENLTEDSFISNLHHRYKRDNIYVTIEFFFHFLNMHFLAFSAQLKNFSLIFFLSFLLIFHFFIFQCFFRCCISRPI
jgi:hypothetical protein